MALAANLVRKQLIGGNGCGSIFCGVEVGEGKVGVKDMNDRKELYAAVAAAGAASAGAPGEGDDGGTAERYEGLLAYVKRHASR